MLGTNLSHYKILQELGRGGMGIVYKAEDSKLNRTVALKLLPPAALGNEEDRARFFREAQAAAQLHHANIATIFAIEEYSPDDGEQRPFIAMEYIEGETLSERIKSGPLKLPEAVRIASQVANALEAAHEKNIVHRDVKSGNVMLTTKGVAKVLDFGLAKTAQSTKLTQLGSTLGTIAYMSPEQARGEEVDRRSDIWSLGVLIYEMIAGRLPFASEYEQAAVYSILNEVPEPLTAIRTGVPMGLEWIVNKCLAKDVSKRYANVGDLLIDLNNVDVSTGSGVSAQPLSAIRMAPASPGRPGMKPWVIAGTVGLACLALGLLLGKGFRSTSYVPVTYSQLVVPSADFRMPSLSPDGRYLVFLGSSGTTDATKIYTYDFATGQTKSMEAERGVQGSRLSPDGTRLGYTSGGTLFTRPLLGGNAIELAASSFLTLSWIGNERIVYTSSDSRMLRVVDVDGDKDVLVEEVEASRGETGIFSFGTLPDGRVLVVKDRGGIGKQDLYALDIDSGGEDLIIEGDGFFGQYIQSGFLLYSPEGTRLFARAFDPDRLEFLGPPVSLFTITRDFPFGLSESGRFVLLTSENYQTRALVRVDMAGKEYPLGLPEMDYEELRVSPSGKSVAVEVNRYEGRGDQVVIAQLDGSDSIRRLTFESSNYEPTWSPDGDRIIFPSERGGRASASFYVRNADGSGLAEWITPNAPANIGYPDWARNGDLIAYSEDNWGPDGSFMGIYSIKEDTVIMTLNDPETGYAYPRISPNSRYLAYRRTFKGSSQLWVTAIDGSVSRPVVTNGGNMPVWSPDGKTLYFERSNGIFAVDIETEGALRVVGFERQLYMTETTFYFDVLPDNSGFILSKSRGEIDQGIVTVIDNFDEVLRREVSAN